jgi:predicted enzyme related to lactoylglutathione lyase
MSRRLIEMVSAIAMGVLSVAVAGGAAAPSQARAGEFVWHDLVTSNPAMARAFYGGLFGWTFEAGEGIDPGYTLIRHEGRQIGGIVPLKAGGDSPAVSQWVTYVVVADVDKAAAAFRAGGGRVVREPLTTRRGVRVAIVSDPQGAPLGLASQGPPLTVAGEPAGPPGLHRWLWMDYVARDASAALAFYAGAVGFTHEISEAREDRTYYLLTTDVPRAGLFLSPWKRETSAWLPYIRVADPAASAARAVELGGTIALAPRPDLRNGSLAIVLDPSGAPLALQKFPFRTEVTP